MNYKLIIIRYGEIGLKAKQTRKRFENKLITNIKNALEKEKITNKIMNEWGRIYVHTTQINQCNQTLKKIFGITSFSPAIKTKSDLESISKLSLDFSNKFLTKEKTFAIRATRTGDHNYTSQDVAVKIGSDVVKETKASVNLTNPDFELFIEIRDENAYIFTEKIIGTGGLPLGTQGQILALIDTPRSILAAWYLMKRGCKITFININKSNKKSLSSFSLNWYANSQVRETHVDKKNLYNTLNEITSQGYYDALVTGFNINNNPEEILQEIKNLKKHITIPVLHPLIAMEEKQINLKCKQIGLTL